MGKRESKTWPFSRLASDIGRALIVLFVVALFPVKSYANQAATGFCQDGGISIVTVGIPSTNVAQGSFPGCTVTVFIHGGSTLAQIFSDNGSPPTAKSNPFTASAADGSWLFYAGDNRYDITMSGGGLVSPVTITDVLLHDPANPLTPQPVFIATTHADRSIILQNPDFEGNPQPTVLPPPAWLLFGAPTVTYETIAPAPGKVQSIKIASTVVNTGIQNIQRYSLFAGDTYSLQIMAKSDGTGIPLAEITFINAADTQIGSIAVIGTTSTTWTQFSNSGTVPANAIYALVLLLNHAAAQPSTVWFDQIDIQKTNFLSLNLGVPGAASGILGFNGFTSGTATFTAPAVAGTIGNPVVSTNAFQAPILQLGSTDTGISRDSAGVIDFGNGTQADKSAQVNATIVNAVTGFRVNNAATNGHCLIGNGTNYVDAVCSTGVQVQVFTSSGTFTIPVGVTNVKATVVGGGGGGAGTATSATNAGAGGGGGGCGEKWLSGLTPGNTITVTVGTGGAGGAAGSNPGSNGVSSSISSGTQIITTVTGSLGNGALAGAGSTGGQGGGGTNGDLNIQGGGGGSSGNVAGIGGYGGGTCLESNTGQSAAAGTVTATSNPGQGGPGAAGAASAQAGGNGATGIVIFEWVH